MVSPKLAVPSGSDESKVTVKVPMMSPTVVGLKMTLKDRLLGRERLRRALLARRRNFPSLATS